MRYPLYGLMSVLLLFNLEMLRLGGGWLWLGLLTGALMGSVIDEAAGLDLTEPGRNAPVRFFNFLLYLTVPLLILNSLALAALIGGGDPLHLSLLGFGAPAARAATGPISIVGGILALGLFIGASGSNVAHELVHRTADQFAMAMGRCLLALSFDTSFAIEHVYGHHRNVGTYDDPATARRGEYVLTFFWRVLKDGNISAWNIEAARLARKGLKVWGWHNRFLLWQVASMVVLAVWWMVAGWVGVFCALAAGFVGKFFLEGVDYIEHYGLVRVPGTAIEARHSWNCHHTVTNRLLYNLARHSHHHRFAGKPFWNLEVEPAAPEMPFGYMTMIIAALVPSLWHRLIDAPLVAWDREMATAGERAIATQR